MARTGSATTKEIVAVISAKLVEQSLAQQKYDAAINAALKLYRESATPEHLQLLQNTLITGIRVAAANNQFADFHRRIQQAEALTPENPAWRITVGKLHAEGTNVQRGLAWVQPLNDPAAERAVLLVAADFAVQKQSGIMLPANLKPGLEAIITAFRHYEANRDEQARKALELIGIRSPFLEWKIFLRGLLAFSQNDHPRAIDNWKRLNPDRLPWRLAAPMRYSIDPTFAEGHSDASLLQSQYRRLFHDEITANLSEVNVIFTGRGKLKPAFDLIAPLIPKLRAISPTLVTRIAHCFYGAILRQGEPQDMNRYRRVFQAPSDDPQFLKLEALILEQLNDQEIATDHWHKYEQWLEKNPPGWPPDLVRWVRAIILLRIAAILENREYSPEFVPEDFDKIDVSDSFRSFFNSRSRRSNRPDTNSRQPEFPIAIYKQAAELTPEWELPILQALTRLIQTEQWPKAEQMARWALQRQSGSVKLLDRLVTILTKQDKYSESLDIQLQLLAKNPLDRSLRIAVAQKTVALARLLLHQQRFRETLELLERQENLCQEHTADSLYSLRAVIAQRQGQKNDAERFRAKAIAQPDHHYSGRFLLSVDAILAKLKPAERRLLELDLAESLAQPEFTPASFRLYFQAASQLTQLQISYRGQAAHLKKAHDLFCNIETYHWPMESVEEIVEECLPLVPMTVVRKVLTSLLHNHPENILFLLLAGEYSKKYQRTLILGKARYRFFDLAYSQLQHNQEPRYERLRARIERHQSLNPFQVFSRFFS